MAWRLIVASATGLVLASVTAGAQADKQPLRLSMPDGQLRSHSVRVYINRDVTIENRPRLRLLESHAVTKEAADRAREWEPGLVATGQEWTERTNDQTLARTGTLLVFDLSGKEFPAYKAMMRVTPVLTWSDATGAHTVIAPNEVNLGNIVAAIGWTILVVASAVLMIVVLAWSVGGRVSCFLTGVDGHLSLAQTQVACWTILMGGVVLGYGLIRLEVPTIPASLVALMGASLATGGVGYFRDAKRLQETNGHAALEQASPRLQDLIRVYSPGSPPEFSLAKAQMIFWTAILVVLFVSKSILDGAIWDVPWPLVALMGFSQAGFLAPKFTDASTPAIPRASVKERSKRDGPIAHHAG